MALIPACFFVALGLAAMLITQGVARRSLEDLSERSLSQVAAGLELVFREADSLALGASTDPEFAKSLEYSLEAGIGRLADLKISQGLQSSLASAVNSRRYLHSICAYAPNAEGSYLSTVEGPVSLASSMDSRWLEGTESHVDSLAPWTVARSIVPFPSLSLSIPVLSFYRNVIGSATLERKGVMAVNVDLRYIEGFLEGQDGYRYLLVDRRTRSALAGFPCSPAELEALLGWLDEGPAERARPVAIGGERQLGAALASERFPFAYFVVAPAATFHRSSRAIGGVAVAFALTAFALGSLLVLDMARRNARLLDGIMDIVEAAGSGKPLPALRHSRNEALNYISLSVLRTFVEHDYYKLRLREREYLQRSLELRALQSQMNPHFLFNTLTTIGFKAMSLAEGPNGVSRMVELLSSILRYALADPTAPVTVRDELENTRVYCEIQTIRFGDGLRYSWRVDEAVLGLGCPRLVLQPLVENAIEHGFAGGAKRGAIAVAASSAGGRVELSVEDDGAGIADEALAELERRLADESAAAEHLGLANTFKRLRLTYGEEAACAAARRPEGGTRISLSFPTPGPSSTPEDLSRSTSGRPG